MRRLTGGLVLVLAGVLVAVSPGRSAELDPDLRARVDALIADVAEAPTAVSNVAERIPVLWEWANAVSLQGGFVPKNLPLVAFYGPFPRPGTEPAPFQLASMDDYVRQLAWLEEDAEALGTVTRTGSEVFEARSWVTIEVVYMVGSLGMEEGGGIVISTQGAGGYGRLQTTDPAGDHYVSARVSQEGISLEQDAHPIWGPYGGFRGPAGFPTLRVRGGELSPGDTITLTYGDRSGGSRGLGIGEFSNDRISLPSHVDPGDGRVYEMPPATYEVVGGAAERIHGFAPSIVGTGEPFVISVRAEDRFYNRATRDIPGLHEPW